MIVKVGTIIVIEPWVQIEGQATNDDIARRWEWEVIAIVPKGLSQLSITKNILFFMTLVDILEKSYDPHYHKKYFS